MTRYKCIGSQKRRVGKSKETKKLDILECENNDCTLSIMNRQTQILDYFRVVCKSQDTVKNKMFCKDKQNENISTRSANIKDNSILKKCTSTNSKRVSNKIRNKGKTKQISKRSSALQYDMHVLTDSDACSTSSTISNINDIESSDSDDPDKNDFVKRKIRTSQSQQTIIIKTTTNGSSPKKIQRTNNVAGTVLVAGNHKSTPNQKSSKISSALSSGNVKNNTAHGSCEQKICVKRSFSDSSKVRNSKPKVSRNIFLGKKDASVQVNILMELTSDNEKSSCESMSTTGISQNGNIHEVKRNLNVASQVNEEDMNIKNTTSSQPIRIEKNSTPVKDSAMGISKQVTPEQIHKTLENERTQVKKQLSVQLKTTSSACKQSVLTQMKFKTNKSKIFTNKAISPSEAKSDASNVSNWKENRYNEVTHSRLCERVRIILKWVFENQYFKVLFTKKETDLLHDLFNVDHNRQLVICLRLYTRLSKWYNLFNFCKELNLKLGSSELKEILQNMTEKHFVERDYSKDPVDALLEHLQKEDIKDICSSFKLKTPSKKQCMINALVCHSRQQSTLTSLKKSDHILRDRVTEKLGVCIKLSPDLRQILYRLHLLYSLTNSDLDSAHDIYQAMEKLQNESLKYPERTIESIIIFKDRHEFLTYEQSLILIKEFDEQKREKDIENEYRLCKEAHRRLKELLANSEQLNADDQKPLFLRRFSAPWIYCSVLFLGSQNLGKHYPNDVCEWLSDMLKQEIYCVRKRGLWYTQLALVQKTHQKDGIAAAQTILNGLSDKLITEVNKHELSIRGSKVRKGKLPQMLYDQLQCALLPECTFPEFRTISATVVHNNEPGKKVHFVTNTSDGKEYSSVEQTAITYYTTELNFTDGMHCEGSLLTTLFFIIFWDILYKYHVPKTFITELQSVPLDLYSGEFYFNRSAKIDARLKDIREIWNLDTLCQFISKMYTLHNVELKSVHPNDFGDDNTFHMYVRCIGKNVIAAVCERLAKDYKQFRSGLPDLFLWDSKELKCCFVEVKSERDTLSTNQILWLHYLKSFGANVEVCYVESKVLDHEQTRKLKTKILAHE